ncbi:hypothetical protein [Candidatus Palauibacter sp.]|uniref:hypothetical protein n=1 Tax=Candidatus Palauibacter sp. TaxID=3101350 RepID=UPI003B5AA2DE
MSEWVEIAVSIGGAVIVWTCVAIQWILMRRDRKIRDREHRHRELEARIDERYRELQREVQDEIRREIRNELRHQLRHEIRNEVGHLERRLGGRLDTLARRRIESPRSRGHLKYGA